MGEILRYVVVDTNNIVGSVEYDDYDEAVNIAREQGDCAVVEWTYVLEDTDLAWTPYGATWPPDEKSGVVTLQGIADKLDPSDCRMAIAEIAKNLGSQSDWLSEDVSQIGVIVDRIIRSTSLPTISESNTRTFWRSVSTE